MKLKEISGNSPGPYIFGILHINNTEYLQIGHEGDLSILLVKAEYPEIAESIKNETEEELKIYFNQ